MTKKETEVLQAVVKILFNLNHPRDPNRMLMNHYVRATIHMLAEGYTKRAEMSLEDAMRINEIIDAEIKKGDF